MISLINFKNILLFVFNRDSRWFVYFAFFETQRLKIKVLCKCFASLKFIQDIVPKWELWDLLYLRVWIGGPQTEAGILFHRLSSTSKRLFSISNGP